MTELLRSVLRRAPALPVGSDESFAARPLPALTSIQYEKGVVFATLQRSYSCRASENMSCYVVWLSTCQITA